MCGICGAYHYGKESPVSEAVLNRMNEALAHRGPDGEGVFVDTFIGLGHRRLSVIDLQNGKQPMTNEDHTVWVTYNGEIYNFRELKRDLENKGHRFVTDCDTEVIVHSYEEYGPDCVRKFNGMFAFAIWDEKTETLFLARDRLGVKPLYYSLSDKALLFASEVKAILQHPDIRAEAEPAAIPEYLFCTSLLNEHTMFKHIQSVPPGHTLLFRNKTKRLIPYWDITLRQSAEEPQTFGEYKEHTLALLQESVRMRLMSDVPFGSLLSGGLDSSLITAIAAGHATHRLKTFSMEYGKNSEVAGANSDTIYARLMADALQTDHKEFIFRPEDYHDMLEKTTWHVEKPVDLTTPSVYLLYQRLKSDVTVVLSGEGSDELFGGYFFFLNHKPASQLTEFPWAPYLQEVSGLLNPDVARQTRFKENVSTALRDMTSRFETDDELNKVLYLFIKLYLLEMLERQDKTSMAWGIEARVPFLDYRIVDYVANIPSAYKLKDGKEKIILKEIARGLLPKEIVERKKRPFPFPVDPKSVVVQKNIANELIQSGNSKISAYFDKRAANDFFNKKNGYEHMDNLAIFRTSHALIALECWHKTFGV
ncbi:asparagine synthase (glutamine-hydrolyzing) [Paenibacillus elgii]|uniref:asparagine synthase (glutamine-hydrolyzing) n=1 Tax=Paenibacillus elgii TaxID=189691 RepID=UPI000248C2C7|nr:asparagine synthase (glutamine-hydrolyzing) [Paenibacillus elgii]